MVPAPVPAARENESSRARGGSFLQLYAEVKAMKVISDRVIDWPRVRNWIVNFGAAWFVIGMLYLMLTGQFSR